MRREPVCCSFEGGGRHVLHETSPMAWGQDLVSLLGLERVVINYSGKGEPCEEGANVFFFFILVK